MYVGKEIITNSTSNQKGIKIGPDAMRFKYVDDEIVLHSPKRVEGMIFDVGLDFVEILQKNHLIVTVLTDRVSHVKWPDKDVRESVSHGKHEGNCKCVEFNRFTDEFVEKEKRGLKMKKLMKQNKKGKKKVKGEPHHCPNCGNFHSRLSQCIFNVHRENQHHRPCGCKKRHVNQHHRPCGCKEQHGKQYHRPCGCKERHVNHHHRPCECKERHVNQHHRPCRCNDHHERHHLCPHCLDEHQNRHHHFPCCHEKFVCYCDFAIPFCDNRFELRLAGLNDDLNFKFLQNKGRHVEMIVE
jgi:hypothetical protein